jgi:hypothetical protein
LRLRGISGELGDGTVAVIAGSADFLGTRHSAFTASGPFRANHIHEWAIP